MVCFFILICILAVTFKSEAIGPLVGFGVGVGTPKCEPTLTTASGSHVIHKINGQFCSGDLIFEDNFDGFDLRKWQHENTLSGNGVIFDYHKFFFLKCFIVNFSLALAISVVYEQSFQLFQRRGISPFTANSYIRCIW